METTPQTKPTQQPILTRVRVTFSKSGSLIYTGALDMQRIWERVLRRAQFQVAYTQGFSPGPRINIASALPLGVSSEQELADFWFSEAPDMFTFCDCVNRSAPPGLLALSAEVVSLSTPALQTRVESAEYRTGLISTDVFLQIQNAANRLLAADSLPRERRGKSYDLRPLILDLSTHPNGSGGGWIEMTLQALESATGRADEVLAALGLEPSDVALIRTKITLKPDSPVVK
jgi:radical SAM-linked protein